MPYLGNILLLQKKDVFSVWHEGLKNFFLNYYPTCNLIGASSLEQVVDSDYDLIITPMLDWVPTLLDNLSPSRPWLHFTASGINNALSWDIDLSPYVITKSNGIHSVSISEYVVAAILYFSKSFDSYNRNSRSRVWDRQWLSTLENKNLVILGAGQVSKQLSVFASCFGMNVAVMKRTPSKLDWCDNLFDISSLDEYLKIADFLVVALPLTPLTKNLINSSNILLLSRDAVLIDVSRGGIVSNTAVFNCLSTGRIRGAALDVFEEEPLPFDSFLWGLDNLILTPHVAGTSQDYFDRFLEILHANIIAYLNESPMPNLVDLASGY